MNINDLLDRYGQLMMEAGMVKGELITRLHFAKEFSEIPEQDIQIQITAPPTVPTLPAKRKPRGFAYTDAIRLHFREHNQPMKVDDIFKSLQESFPDYELLRPNLVSALTRLVSLKELTHAGRGVYANGAR